MTLDPNATPKTLIVDLSKHYGGSTSRVLSIMLRMPSEKIALAVLESSAIQKEAQALHLPTHVIGRKKTDPRLLSNLIKLIRKENFQVLDSQNIQSKFWASLAASLTDTVLVSTIHSWYASEHGKSSLKGKIYSALELATNRRRKQYITVSARDRQSLLNFGIPDDCIELIYNAVDVNPDSISGSRQWLNAEFNIPPDSIVCIAVGRLVQIKGFDVLIKAIHGIESKVPQLICLIIGEGELKQELTNQIQQSGLQNKVRLLGFYRREQVLALLKSSDIFVMPSLYEGTPIALLEAAALSLPILASDTGGIPELVQNEQDALLVPPEDANALAQGLLRLSQDRPFAIQLGRNAREKISSDFNLNSQILATIKTYHQAWAKYHTKATNHR